MQHLDEGTIHAWLDGALSADEATRVERHATECADCAALVAEARGLVAGASRILSALDEASSVVPLKMSRPPVMPQERAKRASVGISSSGRSRWTRPAALAAAAGVVLMAGSAIVLNRAGGRASLGPFVDSVRAAAGTREESVPLPGVAAEAPGGAAPGAARGDGRGAAGAATSSRAAVPVPPPPQQVAGLRDGERRAVGRRAQATRVPAGDRAASAASRDSGATLEPVVPTAVASVAQKAAAAPSAASTLNEPASAPAAAPPVAAPARAADAAPQQRLMAPERAQGQRAAGGRVRAEQLAAADAAESRLEVRVDTVYTQGRVDTVIVGPPRGAFLRPRGAAASVTPVFAVTGCYQIVEGGLRDTLTLSKTRAWSGTAEARFHASVPGATGFWSQPPNGDIHIQIRGALVTARIDPSSGDLRGSVRRGGPSERFFARRCR